MENFSELVKRRRSMRKFTEEELTQDEVVTLLKAALMSPTSKRSESWQFIAVDDKETLGKLAQCKAAGAAFVKDAALAIVVMGDPLLSDVWIEDASVASTMILMQAEDLNLGSCWIQVRGRFGAMDEPAEDFVRETLGIPEEMGVLCILSIGHKDEERKPFDEEKMMWEKVHIGKW